MHLKTLLRFALLKGGCFGKSENIYFKHKDNVWGKRILLFSKVEFGKLKTMKQQLDNTIQWKLREKIQWKLKKKKKKPNLPTKMFFSTKIKFEKKNPRWTKEIRSFIANRTLFPVQLGVISKWFVFFCPKTVDSWNWYIVLCGKRLHLAYLLGSHCHRISRTKNGFEFEVE